MPLFIAHISYGIKLSHLIIFKSLEQLKYQLQWPRIQEEGSTAGRVLLHHEEASTDPR